MIEERAVNFEIVGGVVGGEDFTVIEDRTLFEQVYTRFLSLLFQGKKSWGFQILTTRRKQIGVLIKPKIGDLIRICKEPGLEDALPNVFKAFIWERRQIEKLLSELPKDDDKREKIERRRGSLGIIFENILFQDVLSEHRYYAVYPHGVCDYIVNPHKIRPYGFLKENAPYIFNKREEAFAEQLDMDLWDIAVADPKTGLVRKIEGDGGTFRLFRVQERGTPLI